MIDIYNTNNYFFIGISGDGMSAVAQYLAGIGKNVSGSDRLFKNNNKTYRQKQLETEGIKCFPQDTSGINDNTEVVIVSSAIESSVSEYQFAVQKNIPVFMRSDLLAAISRTKKTIAVAGTSGKSTVAAMIFHIMQFAEKQASLITGAGLIEIQIYGKIGNAVAGKGKYLIIEADESDGSVVKYNPETGIILNIDKDHKEIPELMQLFKKFAENSDKLIVNNDTDRTKSLSVKKKNNFGFSRSSGFRISNFKQIGFEIIFTINGIDFKMQQIGKHNAENAAAAVAACSLAGIPEETSADALKSYKGIFRRHQIIEDINGITLIDDYAHNPAKLAASIRACQFRARRLIVWFQPHGFKPTKFLQDEFVNEISSVLRDNDEIWMSEIYYAGGTVERNITADDLIQAISAKGKKAFFMKDREMFPYKIKNELKYGDIILLTGARDPSLKNFAEFVKEKFFAK